MNKNSKRTYIAIGIVIVVLSSVLFVCCITNDQFFYQKIALFVIYLSIVLVYLSVLFAQLHFNKQKTTLDNDIQFLNNITNQIISVLLNVIEAKDEYTLGHSIRVAEISKKLAKKLGLTEEETRDIYYMALLHDVGKIKIPNNILKKQDRLTTKEFEIMKKHTIYGAKMFKDFSVIPEVSQGMLYHHEHYDGSGYPQKLSGTDIPLPARIIAVADSFDTMNTKRCYRDVLHKDVIIAELINGAGSQFDPEIVKVMLSFLRERPDIFNNF